MIREYIEAHRAEAYKIIAELCKIPAPSHFEDARAEYCKRWLDGIGAKGVYIDCAKNVIFPMNCEDSRDITVFAAHTDTVFPDTEPMPYFDDGERIHSPGAADDTASVAVLLLMAKYFVVNGLPADKSFMFVCNSCEEGLGNLKGTRQLFSDFEGRIARFISFDAQYNMLYDGCVGSHRYEVTAKTEGGHSFYAFGKSNAIAVISDIVSEIYKIDVPNKAGTRTTYNVGTVSGGTSVNTVAQEATILCEYRSDDVECLEFMKNKFESTFNKKRGDDVEVLIKKVGDRPCANVADETIEALKSVAVPIIEDVIGEDVRFGRASTDCNIPLSLGVPAICVGVNKHDGVHTREEWVDKESVIKGLEIAIRLGSDI